MSAIYNNSDVYIHSYEYSIKNTYTNRLKMQYITMRKYTRNNAIHNSSKNIVHDGPKSAAHISLKMPYTTILKSATHNLEKLEHSLV